MRTIVESVETADTSSQVRDLRNKVHSYRGGYAAHERREVEAMLFSGSILGNRYNAFLNLQAKVSSVRTLWKSESMWATSQSFYTQVSLQLGVPMRMVSAWSRTFNSLDALADQKQRRYQCFY